MALTGKTEAEIEFGEPFRIDLGHANGGHIVFHTWNDVYRWADEQLASWIKTGEKLKNRLRPQGLYRDIAESMVSPLKRLKALSTFEEEDNSTEREKLSEMMEGFRHGAFPIANSEKFSKIHDLIDDAPFVAIGLVFAIMKIDPLLVIDHYTEVQQASILSAYNSQQSRNLSVDEEEAARGILLLEAQNVLEQITAARNEVASLETAVGGAGKRFDSLYDEYEKQLEQLRQSYVSEFQLEEPSRHWNSQAELYKGRYEAAVAYMLAVISGLAIFGYWGAPAILTRLTAVTGDEFQYSHIAVLIIIAGGTFWIMNIVSKQINHSRTRKADAEFRKTASDTFIALLKDEDRPISDSEKQIVLAALFRPPSDDFTGNNDGMTAPNFLAHILNELRGKP